MKINKFTSLTTATLASVATLAILEGTKNPSEFFSTTVKADTITSQTQQSTTQQQFINNVAPNAVSASSKYGTYTSVMIAQGALESGWAQSDLSKAPNYNLFGIKGSYNGQFVTMNTTEYGSDGNPYNTTAQFKKYPSYTESFSDNGSLLRNGIQGNSYIYQNTWVENANSSTDGTHGLQGIYATDPSYAAKLDSIITSNNLSQYDPVSKVVNETKILKSDTMVTSFPVETDVSPAITTLKSGQSVNISRYITYSNGVSHAYISNVGWVNASALTTLEDDDNYNSFTGKVKIKYIPNYSIAIWTNPNKKTTGKFIADSSIVSVNGETAVNGHTWYRLAKNQWIDSQYTVIQSSQDSTDSYTKIDEQAKINYIPGYGIAVWSKPGYKTTGVYVKHGSIQNVDGKVDYNGDTWYRLSENHWIDGKYLIIVPDSTESYYSEIDKNVKVNYIPGYGIAIWSKPGEKTTGQYLQNATVHRVNGQIEVNGKLWYRLDRNQWIDAQYVIDNNTTSIDKISGSLTINYRDDQAVTVWNAPGGQPTGRYLSNKTSWKYFDTKYDYGETWYNLGSNQWVSGQFVTIKQFLTQKYNGENNAFNKQENFRNFGMCRSFNKFFGTIKY